MLTGVQVLADSFAVAASFLAAFYLWKWIGPSLAFDVYEPESILRYSAFFGVTLLTSLVGLEVHGLYQPQRSLMNVREFELVFKVWGKACHFTQCIHFLAHQLYFSRGIFILTWSFLLCALLFERYAFFKFNNFLRRRGFVETVALVYGAGEVGRKLIDKFKDSPKLGMHVAGFIDDNPTLAGRQVKGIPVLGDFTRLQALLRETGAEKIFIALPQVPSRVVIDILNVCRETGCEFQIVPSLYDIVIQRVKITELEGIPLIGMSEPTYSWRTRIAKRLFDIVGASFLLAVLSPLFACLALAVKLTSKGPVIFVQKRIGFRGKRFRFYKFRSMRVDAPMYAITPQHGQDNRITPVGRFLRKSSLDELPQLISVLKGDMSLVGPRPEMPFLVSKYNDLQRQRLNVKPGITGLWQISADRKNAIHENMDYDIYYINNQSFLLDMVILLRTVWACVRGSGA
jgi:exopolysaccharide biosynthesis polyprenyl glycosylphosphotransferase